MSLGAHKADWEELASLDPMWAILSHREKRGNKWQAQEFFATGKEEVDRLMAEVGGHLGRRGKALDFGCGLGRLTRAMLGYFDEAHGLDVSEVMIRKAREFTPQCQFHVNDSDDLSRFPSGTFDLVYSNIVLQHLPSQEMIRKYVSEFFRVATPGGLVVFQVPFRKSYRNIFNLKRTAYRLLRAAGMNPEAIFTRFKLHPMRMTAVPRQEMIAVIGESGGQLIKQQRDASAHYAVFYYCRRLGAPARRNATVAAGGV